MSRRNDRWIRSLDWLRLFLAVVGLFVTGLFVFTEMNIDLDYILSNVLALYVLLMGIKVYLTHSNRLLAWFYLFFSAMMLIVVNMIRCRFGL